MGAFIAKLVVSPAGPSALLLTSAAVQVVVGLFLAPPWRWRREDLLRRPAAFTVIAYVAAGVASVGYLAALASGPAAVVVPLVATSLALDLRACSFLARRQGRTGLEGLEPRRRRSTGRAGVTGTRPRTEPFSEACPLTFDPAMRTCGCHAAQHVDPGPRGSEACGLGLGGGAFSCHGMPMVSSRVWRRASWCMFVGARSRIVPASREPPGEPRGGPSRHHSGPATDFEFIEGVPKARLPFVLLG